MRLYEPDSKIHGKSQYLATRRVMSRMLGIRVQGIELSGDTMAAAIRPPMVSLQPGSAPSTVSSSMSAAFLLPGHATVVRRMRAGAAATKGRPNRKLALFQSAAPRRIGYTLIAVV